MAVVTVNPGESIDSALRRFKRKVMTEEIIKDAKRHAFFMPPGQKAKLKSALARKRIERRAARDRRVRCARPAKGLRQGSGRCHPRELSGHSPKPSWSV